MIVVGRIKPWKSLLTAFIFGTILVLNMCQNSTVTMKQPAKGVMNVILSAAIGSVLLIVYQQLQPTLSASRRASERVPSDE